MDATGEAARADAEGGGPLLAYDGDCPLCTRSARWAVRLRLLPRERLVPIAELEPELGRRVAVAGGHDELAVWDPESDTIRVGVDGILWALRGSWARVLLPVLGFGPLRWALRHVYRTIAYNRRVISPPKPGIRCACDPLYHAGYRWALALGGLVLFVLVAGLFARLVLGPAGLRWIWPGLAGGYLAAFLPALTVGGRERTERLGHLAVVANTGLALLLPVALLGWALPRVVWITLLSIAPVATFFVTDRMVDRRREGLGLIRRETLRWWMRSVLGAAIGLGLGFVLGGGAPPP